MSQITASVLTLIEFHFLKRGHPSNQDNLISPQIKVLGMGVSSCHPPTTGGSRGELLYPVGVHGLPVVLSMCIPYFT